MDDPRHELGERGERLAELFLRRAGLRLVVRNFATPVGELDLIVRDGPTIVFVEVKTRRDRRFANPEEAVDDAKLRRMAKAARWYLSHRGWTQKPCRIDVVGIVLPAAGEPEVEHFVDVYAPQRW